MYENIFKAAIQLRALTSGRRLSACLGNLPGNFVLLMEGDQVQSLVRELDPTCHNYELLCHS